MPACTLEVLVPTRAAQPQMAPAARAITETPTGTRDDVMVCPLLRRPCKEIPKQPGFKTCLDCTVYKVWQIAESVDQRFWY